MNKPPEPPISFVREPHPKRLSARLDIPSDQPFEECRGCRELCAILYVEQRFSKSPPMCKSCHINRLEQRFRFICVWCEATIRSGAFKHQCFLNAEGGRPIVHVCTTCGEAGVTYQLVQERFGEAALYNVTCEPVVPNPPLTRDDIAAVLASADKAFE